MKFKENSKAKVNKKFLVKQACNVVFSNINLVALLICFLFNFVFLLLHIKCRRKLKIYLILTFTVTAGLFLVNFLVNIKSTIFTSGQLKSQRQKQKRQLSFIDWTEIWFQHILSDCCSCCPFDYIGN